MGQSKTHQIGIIQSISYIIGDIIGTGIFITPVAILQHTGSVGLSLITWTLCGLLSMLGGLCYIELGTSIPQSGGDYAYICYVGWKAPAFALFWDTFIIYKPCGIAIILKTAGSYIIESIAPLLCMDEESKETCALLSGFLILGAMTFVNFFPIERIAGNIQVVMTSFKISALAIIIGTGLYFLIIKGDTEFYQEPFKNTHFDMGNFTLALYSGLWAYDGWDTLNFGIEEIKNPRRTLTVCIIVGILFIMLVYILTICSYIAVLGPVAMLKSKAVAASFSNVALGDFSYAIPVIVTIVMAGSLNATIFTTSRLYSSVAREKHLPSFMTLTNIDTNSPQGNLIVYAFSGVLMSFIPDLDTLVNFVSFVSWLQRCVTISAIMWIRIRNIPVSDGAIKFPLVLHFVFLMCCILLVVVPIYRDPLICLVGFGVTASGVLVYIIFIWPTSKLRVLVIIDDFLVNIFQKLFLGAYEVKEIHFTAALTPSAPALTPSAPALTPSAPNGQKITPSPERFILKF